MSMQDLRERDEGQPKDIESAARVSDARADEDRFTLRDFVLTVVEFLVIAFVIHTFVLENFRVPSPSMEPTIMVGNAIGAEKLSRWWRAYQPGDIVFFEDPRDAQTTLVKRVIATEGQVVDLVDGKVVVDGEPLDESYAQGSSYPLDSYAENLDGPLSYPITVPEGCLWVMGDNRENSADSRYFGPVSASSVSSRAVLIYWPLSDVHLI